MNEKKFDGMGEIYSNFRPSYPNGFIEYLYNEVGVDTCDNIADIGSGTGKLTEQLLEIGNKVYAVEPNTDMRNIAEEKLSGYEKFISINGTAENTGLPESSVEYITVAQAYHWFNVVAFKAECKRILSKNGRVILVWNSRNAEAESVIECDAVNRIYCPNFKGFSGGNRGESIDSSFSDFFRGDYEKRIFENNLSLDEAGFIGRQLSSSYALKPHEVGYENYLSELVEIFNRHSENGVMTLPQLTKSYVGGV